MRRSYPICPVCSENDFRIKYKRIKGVDGKQYNLIVCNTCNFGTVFPIPSAQALTDFYSTSYASRTKINIHNYENTKDFIDTNKSVVEDNLTLLSLVEPYRTPGQKRLLDVGCGHGFMCYAAKLRGLNALGVDLDLDAQHLGAIHLGVEIINGPIQNVFQHDFDIVTEIMTLEHVRDPRRHISEIRSRLRDGGLYVGSVPNIGGVYARLRGKNWYHLIPPEHLNYFNITTLNQFLQNTGFDVLYIGTIPLYAAPTFCFGIRSWLNKLISKQRSMSVKKMLITLYRTLTLMKRYVLYKPLNFLTLTFKLSGNGIFWVARKKSIRA